MTEIEITFSENQVQTFTEMKIAFGLAAKFL